MTKTKKAKAKAQMKGKAAKAVAPHPKSKHREGLGKMIGQMAGGVLGQGKLGGLIGKSAESFFNTVTGRGAYTVKGNTITSGQPPVFGNGEIVMAHKEYIGDIVVSNLSGHSLFEPKTYSLNPGDQDTFPFLSRIARNFEQYEFLGLLFEFKSLSSATNINTVGMGSVMMATNYDPDAPVFANKREMDASMFSTTSKVYESMIHPIECKPNKNVLSDLYVFNPYLGAVNDDRFNDLGKTTIATQGVPPDYAPSGNGSNLGELWVSYHVRLFKPNLTNSALTGAVRLQSAPDNTASTAATLGTANKNPPVYADGGMSTVIYKDPGNNSAFIINRKGFYLVAGYCAQAGAGPVIDFDYGSNIVEKNFTNKESASQQGYARNFPSVTTTIVCSSMLVEVTADGTGAANTIQFNISNCATANTDLYIYKFGLDPIETALREEPDLRELISKLTSKVEELEFSEFEHCKQSSSSSSSAPSARTVLSDSLITLISEKMKK